MTIQSLSRPIRPRARLTATVSALVLAAAMAATVMVAPPAGAATPDWNPRITERLVKLPATHVPKALDRDFAESPLAQALRDAEASMGFKAQTLTDLQGAIDQAEGEVRTELRHQFLAEKKAYLEMMNERRDLKRRHLAARIKVYDRLLRKLERNAAGKTPAQAALIENQIVARQRLERSVDAVDTSLFGTTAAPESRYAREYGRNLTAMNALIAAIDAHPMNQAAEIDGALVTKPDYVRQLMAETEANLALVDQEGELLGFMARLVALDAMALGEEVTDDAPDDVDIGEGASVASAVEFFVR